jgi:hypothetical protein
MVRTINVLTEDALTPAKSGKARDGFEHAAQLLANRLHNDIVQESCVVFVGAGSTTEGSYRERESFYETIKVKAAYPKTEPSPSFPELMEFFCNELDGGHHNRLIREAISHLERFSLPGEENRFATRFSDLLAEIPYFNRFVTTNWDPFIERSLDVLVPIVEDRDLAFWDDRKKQVLKIHGCITRPYSIVATQTDYDACMARNPLIFNKLKDLMATKTFLFVGYSMRDADFREVWDTITRSLGRFAKLAYAVDPKATPESISFWRERGIELFETYDLLFISCLRKKLEEEGLVPSERFLQFLRRQRRRIVSIHGNLNQNSAGGFASAMYQDGLLHVLDDVLSSTALGIKRNEDFESDLRLAAKQIKQAEKARQFIEVAYWTGRHEIVRRFCDRDHSSIPPYLHPNRMSPATRLVKGR